MNEITRILQAGPSDPAAPEKLLPLVYEELRKLARAKMANELPGQTLQPTALVHEAYLRLVGNDEQAWANHAHFFPAAAEAMRRILIDRATRRHPVRHGTSQPHIALDDFEIAAPATDPELLAIHEALEKFTATDPLKAELVKLKYFAGLSTAEAAAILGLSSPTAKRHWSYARAWLYRELKRSEH